MSSYTIKDPVVGDIVESTYNYKIAKVIEVNKQFGWFVVEYFGDGYKRRHNMTVSGTSSMFRRLREEERADFFLKLENAGITDFWE